MGEEIRVCPRAEHMRKCGAPAITELVGENETAQKEGKNFSVDSCAFVSEEA